MRARCSIAGLTALLLAATLCADQIGQKTASIVSHIRRQTIESRAIVAVGYSKRLQALEIEFHNGASTGTLTFLASSSAICWQRNQRRASTTETFAVNSALST